MKQLKTIVAVIAGLFSFTSAQAGEMTVTGSMHATYQSETTGVTGNPLGINTDLKFAGSTEVLNGTTVDWSMATDGVLLGGAAGEGADSKMTFTNDYGVFRFGNTGDSANAVDDITPTAFEEANGSGSGSYASDFGSGLEGSMGLGYAKSDIFGTGVSIDYTYYPKLDGTTPNEKGATGAANSATKSAQSINVGIPFANLPGVGSSIIGGAKITLGLEEMDAILTTMEPKQGATAAITLPVGPLSLGYQKKVYQPTQTTIAGKSHFKDDIFGIAYAINDELAVSYNVIQSRNHTNDGINDEQETKAINAAYTVGGLTIGLQEAQTDNSGYVAGSSDDTRTISLKTAF